MVKKAIKAEVNTFVKGLITEASPLNFPENASLDECNFELLRNGTRQRRLGLDFEPGYTHREIVGMAKSEMDTANVNTFVWENVGGDPSAVFLVIQINSNLYFYNTNVEILSQTGYINFLSFPSYFAAGKDMSFTSVDGVLVVASGTYDLYYVSYDLTTSSFQKTQYALKTRDFWGVVDSHTGKSNYYQSSDTSAERYYNLYNQSWGIPRRPGSNDNELFDPVAFYYNNLGKVPSNGETVWTALTVKADTNPYEYMRANAWLESIGTDAVAPKGYFIIDPLKRGESRSLAVEENKARFPQMEMEVFSSPNLDLTPGGAKIVKEFAGRVFYAGFSGKVISGFANSPVLSNYLFFSQVVKDKLDLAKCYQEGDPTSRENNDIVDTDGGFIRISGANEIIALESVGASLIVIASNGVWVVTGGGDYGFSATNYKVSEISSFGCVSVKSVVKAGSGIVYWGSNGIYLIEKNNLGDFEVKNLTDGTIQKFYDEISFQEKELSQAVYDDFNKTIRWNYTNSYGFVQQSSVKELILDTKLGAFYYYNIASPTIISLRAVFATPQSKTTLEDSPVLVGSSTINSVDELVVVPYERRSPSQSSIKYVAFETYGNNVLLCFAYYHNQQFKDWGSVIAFDGVDAKAYLLTGGIVAGDSSVNKQAPYISVHFYRTENGVDENYFPTNQSGCLMRSQWGWSNSPNSNKWGQLQQVYRYRTPYFVSSLTDSFDTGFEIITTKNKIRGVGKSVSIYFETEPGKDCKLVGWNISINGNAIT